MLVYNEERELKFSFGTARYYNTLDEDKIHHVIINAARISAIRDFRARGSSARADTSKKGLISEAYVDPNAPDYPPKVISPQQRKTKVGLFYFTKDYKKLFIKAYPSRTQTLKFGRHKEFFLELVKEGGLEGDDYESAPRGFTLYDSEKEVYVVVGGAWLNQKRGEAVCAAFGYPWSKYPWTWVDTPIYTFRNLGEKAGSFLNERQPDAQRPYEFNEMATSCHPKDNGGKYPMWIRVEYTNGEHRPPHAHLYSPEQRPSKSTLITKFIIPDKAPTKPVDIEVMKGSPALPFDYAWMIIRWAKEKGKFDINNWDGLRNDWYRLEKTFEL